MQFSTFGRKFSAPSGITQLMEDLGRAMSGHERMIMLGGGNPAPIPAVQAVWRRRMEALLRDTDGFDRMLANYDTPQGSPRFMEALAGFLRRRYGWEIGVDNIMIMNGGQTALFCLLNMFSGAFDDGGNRRILFPLMPEYVGYADQGVRAGSHRAGRPRIELLEDRRFKYHIDFDALELGDDTGALCVSRPTNPTGNVLSGDELARLVALARQRDVPLIVDNAYGNPFPGIVFTEAEPVWEPHTILTYSLSKLGLPGTRTGIVLGPPDAMAVLRTLNSILSLANGNIGQAIVAPMLEDDSLARLAETTIRPFYRERSEQTQAWLRESFPEGVPCRWHKSEGAMFLWLWFEGLPITTRELYQRLKARGVLVVPGAYFFFGLDEPWRHADECIRINYAHDPDAVRAGVRIIADEVTRAYQEGKRG